MTVNYLGEKFKNGILRTTQPEKSGNSKFVRGK